MTLLIAGLLVWTVIHFVPSLAVDVRERLVAKLGLGPYKGLFALVVISSILLIVFGWRAIEPADVYAPPAWGRHAAMLLVLLTFVGFVAAKRPTNIKRVLRHPQLTGLVLWSIGHLLANGDDRSLVLFGWLGAWAILEMFLIDRRVGAWVKPDPQPVKNDALVVVGGFVVFSVFLFAHRWIAGIPLL